jgi:putative transposase
MCADVCRCVQMPDYKCRHAAKQLRRSEERYTSHDCSRCGHRQPMPLWKRTYPCGPCGLVLDGDENSTVNILQRFLARLGPHTGKPVRCTTPQVQESTRLDTL